MKNFKEIKEKKGFEQISLESQKALKGGANQFEDGCPPLGNNPKLDFVNALQTK